MDVTLVVFDRDAFVLSKSLTEDVRQYIDENYAGIQASVEYGSYSGRPVSESDRKIRREDSVFHRKRASEGKEKYIRSSSPWEEGSQPVYGSMPATAKAAENYTDKTLEDMISRRKDSFHEMLFRLIGQKDMKDSEVWHKANIDHKLFSKIKCNLGYTPSKKTVLALAIGLELNLDQTVDLLARAGFALSPNSISVLVIKYCIMHNIYDMFVVDALLFDNGQPTLGSDA